MKHVEQGDQHVLLLTDAEVRLLKRMIGNGSGDDPADLAATTPHQRAIWNRLVQWAYNGEVLP